MRDIVVLQPQVLFNTITTLIVKTFSCESVRKSERRDFKKGMLAPSTFESVISSEEEIKRGIIPACALEAVHVDDYLNPKKFLQLLVQLRIIALFPSTGDQEEKYFIPCVLNHVPESSQDYPHTDVLPLAVKFQCNHCPKGIFGVLVTHLMSPECDTTFILMKDKIFKDQVFFKVQSSGVEDEMSLKVHSSHLEINFFPELSEDRDVPVELVCHNIREVIELSIQKSLEDLHYSEEKLKPSVCFQCDYCPELHPVIKGKKFCKIHCSKTRQTSSLPLRGRCWYNEGEPWLIADMLLQSVSLD